MRIYKAPTLELKGYEKDVCTMSPDRYDNIGSDIDWAEDEQFRPTTDTTAF